MGFVPETLASALDTLPATRRYLVGYSGGVDSHALLHALVRLRERASLPELLAVHVDHALQPEAASWVRHCERVCLGLDVAIRIVTVDARPEAGEAPEAAARRARYEAFRSLMRPGEILLTAQHRDDQAETVLLQLLRGAGPAGLAAMPELAAFAPGWHARPLLDVDRSTLRRYAEAEALEWIDDPSNRDLRFDRNYLRHDVVPVLRERWPSLGETLARVARHQAQAAELLRELAAGDLQGLGGSRDEALSVGALRALSEPRQKNALREWLRWRRLPLPSEAQLARTLVDAIAAREDAEPLVHWEGVEVRRHRDDLFIMAPLGKHDSGQVIPWDGRTPVTLPELGRRLDAADLQGLGLDLSTLDGHLTVRFRQGGERCRPRGHRDTRELKKLFQEAGVPPWERDRIPLLYCDERLVAVLGYWACV